MIQSKDRVFHIHVVTIEDMQILLNHFHDFACVYIYICTEFKISTKAVLAKKAKQKLSINCVMDYRNILGLRHRQ